jgi:hypothetical protein
MRALGSVLASVLTATAGADEQGTVSAAGPSLPLYTSAARAAQPFSWPGCGIDDQGIRDGFTDGIVTRLWFARPRNCSSSLVRLRQLRTLPLSRYLASSGRILDELERIRLWPNRGTIPAFARRDWGKSRKILTGIADDNHTKHPLNTSTSPLHLPVLVIRVSIPNLSPFLSWYND